MRIKAELSFPIFQHVTSIDSTQSMVTSLLSSSPHHLPPDAPWFLKEAISSFNWGTGDTVELVSITDSTDSVTLSMLLITSLCPGFRRTQPTVETMPPGTDQVAPFFSGGYRVVLAAILIPPRLIRREIGESGALTVCSMLLKQCMCLCLQVELLLNTLPLLTSRKRAVVQTNWLLQRGVLT